LSLKAQRKKLEDQMKLVRFWFGGAGRWAAVAAAAANADA
jgi:hypothetical protein